LCKGQLKQCHDNGSAEHRRDLNPRSNLAPLLSWWRRSAVHRVHARRPRKPCERVSVRGDKSAGKPERVTLNLLWDAGEWLAAHRPEMVAEVSRLKPSPPPRVEFGEVAMQAATQGVVSRAQPRYNLGMPFTVGTAQPTDTGSSSTEKTRDRCLCKARLHVGGVRAGRYHQRGHLQWWHRTADSGSGGTISASEASRPFASNWAGLKARKRELHDFYHHLVRTQPGHCHSNGTRQRRPSRRPSNLLGMGAETSASRTLMAASTVMRNLTNSVP
jgi:hypothetical protein